MAERLGVLTGSIVTPESQFKAGVLKALTEGKKSVAITLLHKSKRYRLWASKKNEAALMRAETPSEFFAELVSPGFSHLERLPVWIDHTPNNFEYFALLRECFPEAKFINLIRDGRAVYSSVRDLPWGPSNPIEAAWWWRLKTSPGLAASATHSGLCVNIHYEPLASGDKDAWRCLTDFVFGCDYVEEKTRGSLTSTGNFELPEYTKEQHRLVGMPPDKAPIGRWKSALTPREIEIFEAEAGGLLQCLGYSAQSCFPVPANRMEKVKMGVWPVQVNIHPVKRWRMAKRWKSVMVQSE